MAAPGLDANSRSGEDSTSEVQQMLDKAIRDIKAVDMEALCILAGRKVKNLLPLPLSFPRIASC
jgi:exosome complex RNA-binding protein Rrp42 (RNase PH superfamily)